MFYETPSVSIFTKNINAIKRHFLLESLLNIRHFEFPLCTHKLHLLLAWEVRQHCCIINNAKQSEASHARATLPAWNIEEHLGNVEHNPSIFWSNSTNSGISAAAYSRGVNSLYICCGMRELPEMHGGVE